MWEEDPQQGVGEDTDADECQGHERASYDDGVQAQMSGDRRTDPRDKPIVARPDERRP